MLRLTRGGTQPCEDTLSARVSKHVSIAIHAGAHGGVKYVRASLGHQDWALEWHNVRGLFEAVIASDLNQAMADVRFLILARVVNEIQEADYERRLAAEAA